MQSVELPEQRCGDVGFHGVRHCRHPSLKSSFWGTGLMLFAVGIAAIIISSIHRQKRHLNQQSEKNFGTSMWFSGPLRAPIGVGESSSGWPN